MQVGCSIDESCILKVILVGNFIRMHITLTGQLDLYQLLLPGQLSHSFDMVVKTSILDKIFTSKCWLFPLKQLISYPI